jgi:simple sugar transport system permease protein
LRRAARDIGIQIGAFVLSMLFFLVLLVLLGYDAGQALGALWDGSAGTTRALGVSLSEATPVILTGVAVWLAAQGGLFNIGADGQLQIGGLAALVCVMLLGLPENGAVLVPVGLLAAALAGAGWAAIAALLKTYRGANEIVSTLMLNFIAAIAISELIRGPLQSETNPYTPQTESIPVAAQLPTLVDGTQLTWGIVIALAVAAVVLLVVTRARSGLRLRAIGLNREAARYSGVSVPRYWLVAMVASGALCGLAGGLVLLGLRYYIAPGWASAWGFQGVLVAFLAMRTPFLIPVWGVLFGMLSSAGPVLKGTASVPDSVVTMMQTLPVVVLFVLYAAARWLRGERLASIFRRGEAPA